MQFHPSYAYEDFVRGFRPALVNGLPGFELKDGPLLQAAERARQDEDRDVKHFLIIDEINRGNLAKVFWGAVLPPGVTATKQSPSSTSGTRTKRNFPCHPTCTSSGR